MQVKPISSLTFTEIRELATHAAERGERIHDVNPFAPGSQADAEFVHAFNHRAAELQQSA